MKILMVGSHPNVKGGISSVIGLLTSHDWSSDGVEMRFIPTYVEGSAARKMLYYAAAYIRIFWCFLTDRPDAVHMHMSYKGSFFRKYALHRLCSLFGIPDVVHLHGSRFRKWYDESDEGCRKKIRRFLQECGCVITLGDSWNHAVREIEPTCRVVTVCNAVTIPKAHAKWNPERFQMLYLGVLIPRKGVSDLLDAMVSLPQEIRLVIAGSGEEENSLKTRCRELGLENRVCFTGWIDAGQREKLLQESQLLVLPSYDEGLPMAVLEGISWGLPVVATDVGDTGAAVRDGLNGFLVQPGEVPALAAAIEKTALSRESFEGMSAASRCLAEKKFSDDVFFEKIREIYRTTVS